MAGLYIHIPFCRARCTYCDFYFVTGEKKITDFVDALCWELENAAPASDISCQISTVYFGGGTPSRLSIPQLQQIATTITTRFQIANDVEWTLELNPEDASPEFLRELLNMGVNRLSIGIQSFREAELTLMGRSHTPEEAASVIPMARDAGFEQISADLIFGNPGQTEQDWLDDVQTLISLGTLHISTYGLTVEPRTLLNKWIIDGDLQAPDDDVMAVMYVEADRILTECGYEHYEISSYALPGSRARHNSAYWDHVDYTGFGPSAHSFSVHDGPRRWANVANLKQYIDHVRRQEMPVTGHELITQHDFAIEYIMLKLRTIDGVDCRRLGTNYGYEFSETAEAMIGGLEDDGLLTRNGAQVVLTPSGMVVSDGIIASMCANDVLIKATKSSARVRYPVRTSSD